MQPAQNNFYVYIHVDPRTEEVVYVGKGKHGRAWDVTRCRGQHREHQLWMLELTSLGFLPTDWAKIIAKNLEESAAYTKEKEYLHNNGTLRFNRQSGERQHQAKMTNEQALEAYQLVKTGWKHKDVADKFGVSRAAISMLASGRQWKAITAGVRE